MHFNVKRTYSSRQGTSSAHLPYPASSPPSVAAGTKRKRVVFDCVSINASPPKRAHLRGKLNGKQKLTKPSAMSATTMKAPANSRSLTQMHFVVDSALRTCPSCSLSYTKGAVEDEALHKRHCVRVQRGLEWGKDEEREAPKVGVRVIQDFVRYKSAERVVYGRIIAVPADASGKIGAKITSLLETINLALSSPALLPECLKCSKVYMFLTPSPSGTRELIAGCVVAQRIASAMDVVHLSTNAEEQDLVKVDGNLYCKPQLYPTPLGIPRLFVPSAHRRQGIAKLLLSAAARTFVYGCELDPRKGEVAFSQPTSDGRKVMENWGKGGVRVYQE